MSRFTMFGSTIREDGEDLTVWDCCDLLNELSDKNEQLKTELMIKEDLIQQLRNALNNNDHQEMMRFRRLYVGVCEELAEMNMDYKKLSDENEQFKKRIGQLEAKLSIQSDIKLNGWKND